MLLGYARVSTTDQDPALQLDALATAGCDRVWMEHASGAREDRPQLAALLDHVRPGDVVVVWRPDRLGRSVGHLVATVADLGAAGVGFRSLTEAIDTTTASGRLTFHISRRWPSSSAISSGPARWPASMPHVRAAASAGVRA